jgi:hypothetical protein
MGNVRSNNNGVYSCRYHVALPEVLLQGAYVAEQVEGRG